MKKYLLGAALVGAMGCGGAQTSAAPGTIPMGRTTASADNEAVAAWKRSCAVEAGGPVDIVYRDEPGGAAVVFTTQGNTAALRERVTEVARYHNSSQPQVATQDLYSIPHSASIEDVENGAKLVLVASAGNDSSSLQRNVQQDVWAMQRAGCDATQEAL